VHHNFGQPILSYHATEVTFDAVKQQEKLFFERGLHTMTDVFIVETMCSPSKILSGFDPLETLAQSIPMFAASGAITNRGKRQRNFIPRCSFSLMASLMALTLEVANALEVGAKSCRL